MKILTAMLCLMASHKVISMATPIPPDYLISTTGFDFVFTMTDLPEEDVDKAFFPEVGNYSTQAFEYVNHQHETFEKFAETYKCYDHYIKCLTTLTVPSPVCAYHSYGNSVYLTRNNYCEVHLENCRLGKRYWKILIFGNCQEIKHRATLYTNMMVSFNQAAQQISKVMAAGGEWAKNAGQWISSQQFFWQG